MKRRDFVVSAAAGLVTATTETLRAAEPDVPETAEGSAESVLVETWKGDDRRFSHRRGGRPHGTDSWLDPYVEPNQNLAVCDTDNHLELDRGEYRIDWDVEVNFSSPACRSPDEGYPVLLAAVSGGSVNGRFKIRSYSQVYVCAHRDRNVYRGVLSIGFVVTSRSTVSSWLSAFNDERTATPTDINAREAIVNEMRVHRLSGSVIDEAILRVHPLG